MAFPYVNGGLFADEHIIIPRLNDDIMDLILHKASEDFDWSEISPTIFGAVFESTLNPETRRSGGMHYTSIENIHKVIDPLFLDDLREELAAIKARPTADSWRKRYLEAFKHKLASLRFLDPACGSGNFLTETYLSLRSLENEVIQEFYQGVQGQMGMEIIDTDFLGIEVSIGQFYGIEINDFAVTVARTALWIAESQMLKKTEDIVHMQLEFLPLNLRLDWESVAPKQSLTYIMGNPPFVGKKEQTKAQKAELVALFDQKAKGVGNLDYVTGWYMKAVKLIRQTSIRAAFVSTNSITQGEQVPIFWQQMLDAGAHIDFAYRTFRWDSEASIKAHVHCVIIGFSVGRNEKPPRLYYSERRSETVSNISPYLVDAPSILVSSRSKPVCDVPAISYGSMPIDDGHLILNKEDMDALLAERAENAQFIRKYAGGVELIQNKDRWCLWLKDASPKELQKSKLITERVKATAEFRRGSNRPQTLALADTPTLFGEIRQPDTTMLVIPKVSSENRRYIPISYVSPEIIVNGSALIVPDASLYHFGVLTSNVHMAWMRAVAGRLEMRYQYSGNVVYNNFPWPNPTAAQRAKIERTAQTILDVRARHADCSLAILYKNPGAGGMPPDLLKAHRQNDAAVWEAYGKAWDIKSESGCVAALMKLYQTLASDG